jgi:hypothetical protein
MTNKELLNSYIKEYPLLVIETRDECKYLLQNGIFAGKKGHFKLSYYDGSLNYIPVPVKDYENSSYDVVKIYKCTLVNLDSDTWKEELSLLWER